MAQSDTRANDNVPLLMSKWTYLGPKFGNYLDHGLDHCGYFVFICMLGEYIVDTKSVKHVSIQDKMNWVERYSEQARDIAVRFNQEFNDIGASDGPGEYDALREVVMKLFRKAETEGAELLKERIKKLSSDL